MLTGVSFAIGGTIAMFMAFCMLTCHIKARSWVEVPAKIIEVRFSAHSGKNIVMYSVESKYLYNYKEREYVGAKVSCDCGSDNIGSFHADAFNQLKSHKESGTLFRCFVNPSDPSEGVIYRDLRYGKLAFLLGMGFLSGIIGCLFIIFPLRKRKKRRLHSDTL